MIELPSQLCCSLLLAIGARVLVRITFNPSPSCHHLLTQSTSPDSRNWNHSSNFILRHSIQLLAIVTATFFLSSPRVWQAQWASIAHVQNRRSEDSTDTFKSTSKSTRTIRHGVPHQTSRLPIESTLHPVYYHLPQVIMDDLLRLMRLVILIEADSLPPNDRPS